ncbi:MULTISPECIES: recombination-associated protein RdgC [Desulfovibrio]|uniref:DNA recombination-dependent growth factor C n=2 Tax=Desulfovibrio TaxID=872 RepID=A0AA94HUV2_DESDE|nr:MULTISPECIES: recombination-associated protein RdgC [Desulfovibrio]SFW69758.1 DNA recombination-dependent growth factor C [Desulfovibrio desulfuricans]SPD35135.1 Putative exonuclease, RdgC, pilus related [Desulfovibrio sp. G11]
MSGFMSSSTAMKIFEAQAKEPDFDKLRKYAFRPAPGPDGKRIGWVGLGDPLDLDFSFGINFGRFMAFSLRIDERKPSSAAIKIRLAEALKEEADSDGKVSGKRKRELKEAIIAMVTSKTDFIPSLTDCIWDLDAQRFYVSTASDGVLTILLELFNKTFGVTPFPISPKTDMATLFAKVFQKSISVDGGTEVSANGYSVTLATPEQQENKAHVAVVNNQGAVATALEEGLRITKMALLAVNGEQELPFTLADDLTLSGLKLPKGEKGDDAEVTFFLKAEACAHVAHIVETLSK